MFGDLFQRERDDRDVDHEGYDGAVGGVDLGAVSPRKPATSASRDLRAPGVPGSGNVEEVAQGAPDDLAGRRVFLTGPCFDRVA